MLATKILIIQTFNCVPNISIKLIFNLFLIRERFTLKFIASETVADGPGAKILQFKRELNSN